LLALITRLKHEQEAQAGARYAETEALRKEAQLLLAEVEAIKASNSWRITAPLRRAVNAFRA
jgi:hypothetical protein